MLLGQLFVTGREYFGSKYGKVTVAVPPQNTSQNCSNCGQKVEKSLSTRTHICPHCRYIEDRDVNAARNILQKPLCTVGHTGTYAWRETPSGLVGFDLSSHGESLSQESPSLNSRGVSILHITLLDNLAVINPLISMG